MNYWPYILVLLSDKLFIIIHFHDDVCFDHLHVSLNLVIHTVPPARGSCLVTLMGRLSDISLMMKVQVCHRYVHSMFCQNDNPFEEKNYIIMYIQY